jgi:uncharacterized C2H2 Zn-finger protein
MFCCGRKFGNGGLNCMKMFKTQQTLNEHIKTSHNAKFKCNKCEKVFTTLNSLQQHTQIKHEETFKIPVGHQKWNQPQESVNFSCIMCPAEFKMEADLKVHVANHEDADFVCNQCDELFESKKQLNDHKKNEHEGFKTVNKLCRYFQQGRCYKGLECSFIHEYRTNMKPQQQHINLSQKDLSQTCRRGPRCEFLAREDCFYFHPGVGGQEGLDGQDQFRGWNQKQQFRSRNQENFRRQGQDDHFSNRVHKTPCHFQDRCWNPETCGFSHQDFGMKKEFLENY